MKRQGIAKTEANENSPKKRTYLKKSKIDPTSVMRGVVDSSDFGALLFGLSTGVKNPNLITTEQDFKLYSTSTDLYYLMSSKDSVNGSVSLPNDFKPFLVSLFNQLSEIKDAEDHGIDKPRFVYFTQSGVFGESLKIKSNTQTNTTGNKISSSNFAKMKERAEQTFTRDLIIGGEYRETKEDENGNSITSWTKVNPITILNDSELEQIITIRNKKTGEKKVLKVVAHPVNNTFFELFKKFFIPMAIPLSSLFITGKHSLALSYVLFRHIKINGNKPFKVVDLCKKLNFNTKLSTSRTDRSHFYQNVRKPICEYLENAVPYVFSEIIFKDSKGNEIKDPSNYRDLSNEEFLLGYIYAKPIISPKLSDLASETEKQLLTLEIDHR